MAFGIGDAAKLKAAWDRFAMNHPRFPRFFEAVKRKGIREGTVIGVSVEYPDGERLETNLRVTDDDLELFGEVSRIGR